MINDSIDITISRTWLCEDGSRDGRANIYPSYNLLVST